MPGNFQAKQRTMGMGLPDRFAVYPDTKGGKIGDCLQPGADHVPGNFKRLGKLKL